MYLTICYKGFLQRGQVEAVELLGTERDPPAGNQKFEGLTLILFILNFKY